MTVLAMAPFTWRGWRLAGRQIGRPRLILLLPAALLAVSLSLLIGNYGTVVRERLQVLVFLVPLTGLGLADYQAARANDARTSGAALTPRLPGAIGGLRGG